MEVWWRTDSKIGVKVLEPWLTSKAGFAGAEAPDLIFQLREIILTRKSRGQCTLATFIDARKAYDTVWREGNYVRLWDMGVRGKLWRQLQAMSADPKSKVRLPFGETEYFHISRGVAQGAVESPFLYACFINALADELKQKGLGIVIAGRRIPLLMYADDIVFLASSVNELREMNKCVTEFARRNRYQLNCGKKCRDGLQRRRRHKGASGI